MRRTQVQRFERSRSQALLLVIAISIAATGCSLRTIAVNKLGDALSNQGDVFVSDDDPELVGAALPFSLKLIESLLAENPRHAGLLLAATRGFTQYGYGWVQQGGEETASLDAAESARQIERARRLYLRARDYGLRGLEVRRPGIGKQLPEQPVVAVRALDARDVPLLYWTAASWGLAISLSKDRPELVADLPIVEAMIDRALELDESYEAGAIHSFLINYELNRAGGDGDPIVRSRAHFDRAVELSGGLLATPFVSLAESVSVQTQERDEFESLLARALAIDLDARPRWRLENLIAQRHAEWLQAHESELFLDPTEGEEK